MRALVLAFALALAACGQQQQADPALAERVQHLEDEREIRRIGDELDAAVDAKDWASARALFADRVAADFTSLGSQSSGSVAADELIDNWRRNLHRNKVSTRSRSNETITVEDDTATMTSTGHVRYELPQRTDLNVWEGWGRFDHHFVRTPQGWRIDGFKFTLERETGEPSVRAETAPPRTGLDRPEPGAAKPRLMAS